MSAASNFLAWLIEDTNTVYAEIGSPRDAQCKEFQEQGFLDTPREGHGENIYPITGKWMAEK